MGVILSIVAAVGGGCCIDSRAVNLICVIDDDFVWIVFRIFDGGVSRFACRDCWHG